MNSNADQLYSNNLVNQYEAQITENTQLVNVIPSSTNRILHHQTNSINNGHQNNDLNERSLNLSSDYMSNSNVNIVNYLPTNLPVTIINTSSHLHHQNHQYIKKCDSNFIQSKEQSHMIHIYGDGNNIIQSAELPVLTPLKYIDYPNNLNSIVSSGGTDEQILMANEDMLLSEKDDDCEIHEPIIKNAKRSLPHKKRIAKKLNSDQFSIILATDDSENIRTLQATNPQFECIECGLSFIGQLEFYMHLKEHYEGQSSMMRHTTKRKRMQHDEELDMHHVVQEDDPNSVPENLIIESLEDSQDDIKSEEIEGDAFGFSEPEDMEDFRKEVEKVVETIGDTECLPDASWSYQDTEIEENPNNVGIIDGFTEKMDATIEQSSFSNQQELKCDSYLCSQDVKDEDHEILHNFTNNSNQIINLKLEDSNTNIINEVGTDEEEEEEDNKPLEEVRLMMKKTKRNLKQKVQNDEEVEFNECLKKIQNFKCNDCNKCFNSRTALGYHLKTHSSERRYVCDQCGKKFLTNGALKVHLRLHTNDRPYKCNFPDCGKSFRQWGDLKYHETSLHSDKKDHICEFCAKAFARKYSLVIHRRIHTGERTYKCTECDKSFRASSYLLNHKRIHSGERPFACPVCGKKFRVQGDLKRHTKIHDRVKNGVVKEKKKPNDTQAISNQDTISSVVSNECVDLSKEKKIMENNVSDLIENLTKKGADSNETSKKIKKSQKKKILK